MAKQRETVEENGWRLFCKGAVLGTTPNGGWQVRGESGDVHLVFGGRCGCEARVERCSHVVAAEHAEGRIEAPAGTVEVDAEMLAVLMRLGVHARNQPENEWGFTKAYGQAMRWLGARRLRLLEADVRRKRGEYRAA